MRNATIKSRMEVAEWSTLVFLSVLWGGAFFFVEVALTAFTPLLLVALRIGLAALVIWAIVLAKGYPIPASRSVWVAFIGMGLLNNIIPILLIVWSQTVITAGLASILTAATPIIGVALAGFVLRDEPITQRKIAGTILGLIGVAILIGPAAWAGLRSNLIAQLAVLAAAASFAFAGVYGRRFNTMGLHPIVAAAGSLLTASIIMIPLLLIFDDSSLLEVRSVSAWAAVGGLAVLSTALGYVLYFSLLEKVGTVNLLLVNLLLPVTAILLGSVVLGEQLSSWQILGMVVIWIGLATLDGRLWQRLFAQSAD